MGKRWGKFVLLVGLREFECQSFEEFLTWKEKEEEDNNTFYAQSTGKKPCNGSTDGGTGNSFSNNHSLREAKCYNYYCRVQVLLFMLSRWRLSAE